jgi:flagellar protein FliS
MQKAAQAYLQTQVTTTGQGEVVILLYDGAIKFLHIAKELLAKNDMAGKGNNISKALDVLSELKASLNVERGGDLARNLHQLYLFCSGHLVKANIRKSPEMIDDVINILSGLRSAYAEILNTPEARVAAQEAASRLRPVGMPSRPQAGISDTGADSAAPGAGARVRAMYARAAQTRPVVEASPQAADESTEQGRAEAQVESIPVAPVRQEDPRLGWQPMARPVRVANAEGDSEALPGQPPAPGGMAASLPGGAYRQYMTLRK